MGPRLLRPSLAGVLASSVCCACSGGGGNGEGGALGTSSATHGVPDATTALADAAPHDAGGVSWPHSTCSPGCSPSCAPPYETCAIYPELGQSCFHEVHFSNGTSAGFCRPDADAAIAAAPLTEPPVYCALDVGIVDASDIADVGPITQCQVGYANCTPPGGPARMKGAYELPGAPGWMCCTWFRDGTGGVWSDWQFECQPPDGGLFPLYFPPPLGADADASAD